MSEDSMQIGRYLVLEEIGSGGFSTVYRVQDTVLGREVALKVMRPLLLSDASFVERFKREAQVMAALDHPHIVPIYDYGEFEDRLCLVMKLMPGRSVGHLVEDGAVPWERVLAITEQVASALDYAHGRGLVHRDVKPHNVLLDDEGRAALSDFGLVRALEAGSITSSLSGGILGTPAYVPPEIWNGETATAPTDVYALACVVFNMATGATLFNAPTPPATMALHFKAPQFPEEWPEGVPPGLERVLAKALARAPDERFASAGAFAEALAALAADPLAEPYAALEAAMDAGRWNDAIALAEQIMSRDAGYRDVRALLAQALEGNAAAERESWAAQWRETTETALAAGEWEQALSAARKWREFAPEDAAAAAAVARAEEALAGEAAAGPPIEPASPPSPEPMSRRQPAPRDVEKMAKAEEETVAPSGRGQRRTLALSVGVVLFAGCGLLAAIVVAILVLGDGNGEQASIAQTPTEQASIAQTPTEQASIAQTPTEQASIAQTPTEQAAIATEKATPEVGVSEEEAATDGSEPIFLMGADGLLSNTFFENVGDSGLGMYFSGPLFPDGSAYENFVSKYEEAYGENPIQAFHSHAYDATIMALIAIEHTAEEQGNGSLMIDRQALIEEMYRMTYDGLTGRLVCNEFGDCAAPDIGIFRFENAEWDASDVFDNVTAGYEYEQPESGPDVVPDAPQSEELGEVVVEAGAPIEVATLQAISGAVANLGIDQVRAIEIALADYGEIAGHRVQLTMIEDALCHAEGGQLGAQGIAANPHIVATIGTSCSGAAVPASEILSQAGILMVSASNTAPLLTATGYFSTEGPSRGNAWSYGYFRTSHNDEFQGQAAAQFAYQELGVRLIATINDGDPYTQGLTSAMGSSFEGFGGEVVLATAVGTEQEDMRPVLTEVAAAGAELVYFPIFEPSGNFIVLQAEEAGLEVARP